MELGGPQTTGPGASENNQKLCICQFSGRGLPKTTQICAFVSLRAGGLRKQQKVVRSPVEGPGALRKQRFPTTPHHTTPHHTTSRHTTPHHTTHHTTQHHTTPDTAPQHTPPYTTPHRNALHNIMLYYSILPHHTLHTTPPHDEEHTTPPRHKAQSTQHTAQRHQKNARLCVMGRAPP